jgi:hypothetical protein
MKESDLSLAECSSRWAVPSQFVVECLELLVQIRPN